MVELSQKKSKKRKAPEGDVEAAHGNGTIMKVKVTNFMCHHNLEVDLGPRINFIVGENGSGKSAVLTAICLALGTKAKNTNRSDKGIKGFIREGATFAKLEVSIRNVGTDAFEADNYGEVITIERTINGSGSTSFKIRNQWGKEVGNSNRDHLLRITDHFNIDVDNPIVVMSQDASRQFLHSGKDTDKYKFFVKATLLEEIQNKLAYVKSRVKEMDALIKNQEAELPRVKQEMDNLQDEADSFKKMEEYAAKADEFRDRLAWADVFDAENTLRQLNEELEALEGHGADELKNKHEAQRALVEEKQREREEAEKALSDFTARARGAVDARKALERKCHELERRLGHAESDLIGRNNDVVECKQRIQGLEHGIKEAQMSVAQQSQAQDVTFRAAIDDAEERVKAIEDEKSAVMRHGQELRARMVDAGRAENDATSAVRNQERLVNDTKEQLMTAEGDDGNLLSLFGRGVPRLVQEIKRNERMFSHPPIGPIGIHVKLKNQKWGKAVEEHMGKIFESYIVASMKDRATLEKLLRECQVNATVIVTSKFGRGKYQIPANKLPSSALTTMMDVIDIENPTVFNVAVDMSGVERVVVVPDYTTATQVAYPKTGKKDPNISQVYSFDHIFSMGKSGFTQMIKAFTRKEMPSRIASDKKAWINGMKETIKQANSERGALLKRADEARKEKAKIKTLLDKNAREFDDVRMKLDHAKIALDDAKAAARDREDPTVLDVSRLEDDLALVRSELDVAMGHVERTTVAKQTAQEALKAGHDELKAAKAAYKTTNEDAENFELKYTAAATAHKLAVENLNYYVDKLEVLNDRVEEKRLMIEQYAPLIQDKITDAEAVCARSTAEGYLAEGETEYDVAQLTKHYERAKKQMERERERHARPQQEVLKLLGHALKNYNRLDSMLKNSRDPCKRLNAGAKQRQKILKETAHEVNKTVSHRFNHYLSMKGHAGKVIVDYTTATLTLDVKMHGQGQTVKDTRAMSGGERSFSTLAMTLSLGESIESPFRAMDEFDVFMDAVNRKVSMDSLIDFARDDFNKDKQFLFITPQDISAVDASAVDIKVQKMKAARPS